MSSNILTIPDTQVREGVAISHIEAAGNYAAEHEPDVIVVIGDFMDTPSLSKYNSNKQRQGLTLEGDFKSASEAMETFLAPIRKKRGYQPRLVMTSGNHEPSVRIKRLEEEMPELTGSLVDKFGEMLVKEGFEVYPFLDVVEIEKIRFSHFTVNPSSAKGMPVNGAIETSIKNVGYSFVSGHQQGLKTGKRYLSDGSVHLGVVAGSFYQHKEDYMSVQASHHWQGIIELVNAEDGDADIVEMRMSTLLKEYL